MGRKANPVASKLLADVEIKKKQEAHRKRLASMKPSLDTKPPPEHKHLYRNAKKEQLMEGAWTPSVTYNGAGICFDVARWDPRLCNSHLPVTRHPTWLQIATHVSSTRTGSC